MNELRANLAELVEALGKRTHMKRAPTGARSTKLSKCGFVPRLGGILVEMPGCSTFVSLIAGHLEKEIELNVKDLIPLHKVLLTFGTAEQYVDLSISAEKTTFSCGNFSLAVPSQSV